MSAALPPIVDTGQGRPIVFCHGMFCPSPMWDRTIAELESRFRCIRFNFYGHGDGLPTFPGMNMYDLANLIENVMNAKQLDRAIVVGFSMGGMAAMRLALRAPQRFEALALLNTTANSADFQEWLGMMMTAAKTRMFGQATEAGSSAEKAIFSEQYRQTHPAEMKAWLDQFMTVKKEDAARIYELIGKRDDVLADFPKLKMPMLILGATRDESTPPVFSLKMADQVAQSIVTFLPQSGHATPYERPDDVSKYLQGFLQFVTGIAAAKTA